MFLSTQKILKRKNTIASIRNSSYIRSKNWHPISKIYVPENDRSGKVVESVGRETGTAASEQIVKTFYFPLLDLQIFILECPPGMFH